MTIRYFSLLDIDNGELSGKYYGKTPKQAAMKCFTKLVKKYKQNGYMPDRIDFHICEKCTGKIYSYMGESKLLDNPIQVRIGDKRITYKRKNSIYRN